MSYHQRPYTSWTASDTVEWIISINPNKFKKYYQTLTSSFNENNFNGSRINDLDRSDLKQFGIINLADRKSIYSSIIRLIATEKRRCSQIAQQQITSLSDDEDKTLLSNQDYKTLLSNQELSLLNNKGYCQMSDETDNELLLYLITGYSRNNHTGNGVIIEIINAITYFHGHKFDIDCYVQLKSAEPNPVYYLTLRQNTQLSSLLRIQCDSVVDCSQVEGETLRHVLEYLSHHRGIKPDPVPCPVPSIHMSQIVTDAWDAQFMDSFEKKTIFEIILAANYFGIESLLHLSCAKIATLIKRLDQNEINRIIEEEDRYRQEQARKEEETETNDNNEQKVHVLDNVISGLDSDEDS